MDRLRNPRCSLNSRSVTGALCRSCGEVRPANLDMARLRSPRSCPECRSQVARLTRQISDPVPAGRSEVPRVGNGLDTLFDTLSCEQRRPVADAAPAALLISQYETAAGVPLRTVHRQIRPSRPSQPVAEHTFSSLPLGAGAEVVGHLAGRKGKPMVGPYPAVLGGILGVNDQSQQWVGRGPQMCPRLQRSPQRFLLGHHEHP